MKIGIVGWGVEGQSAFKYFGPAHQYLIANEASQEDLPTPSVDVEVQFHNSSQPVGITSQVKDFSYLKGIENCDKIIYSVTAAKNLQQLFPKDHSFWEKAFTVQHIFFDEVKTKNIIGVTGTKGKGTTSTLITKMLEATGKKVYLGGNIGISVLDFVGDVQPNDWVVLELSNFQLYSLNRSPHIGVCLMIAPEHMDWHPDIQDYIDAKSNMFRYQEEEDIAIYFPDSEYSAQIASISIGKKIPYFVQPGAFVNNEGIIEIENQKIVSKNEVKLLGEHNLQNVCAAVTAVWQVDKNVAAIGSVIKTFTGLEHRLEFVRELDGVKYYDDSFGTTPETAIVAMKSFSQPKVVILGGSDKGASFEELAEAVVSSNVKHTIVIGDIAEKITTALKDKGYKNISTGLNTMPEIVKSAKDVAGPGDIVLLSTGAASFGLFKNYKDRGNKFKQAVLEL